MLREVDGEVASVAQSVVANAPHALARDAKPDHITGYRTSAADFARTTQSTHNNRDESRRFFLAKRLPDSPRWASFHPPTGAGDTFPSADGTAGGGKPCLVPTADNDDSLAIATNAEPQCDNRHCNTGPTDAVNETRPGNPSEDSDDDAGKLAWQQHRNKLVAGPREVLLPAGQVSEESSNFPPRHFLLVRLLNGYSNSGHCSPPGEISPNSYPVFDRILNRVSRRPDSAAGFERATKPKGLT